MLPEQRRAMIKTLILQNKAVGTTDVAEKLQVSTETVRRDFRVLEREGLLERTRGGATIASFVAPVASNADLEAVFVEEKAEIAVQAARIIRNGSSIFLDSSTTSLSLARQLGSAPITVATNSLAILLELAGRKEINLVAVGGTMAQRRRCFVGRAAREMLEGYYFDIAFLSCRSLDMQAGATDSSDEEADIKTTVAHRANRLVLLADHSKFGRASFSHVCNVADVDDLITDRKPSEAWLTFLKDSSVNVSWLVDTPVNSKDSSSPEAKLAGLSVESREGSSPP